VETETSPCNWSLKISVIFHFPIIFLFCDSDSNSDDGGDNDDGHVYGDSYDSGPMILIMMTILIHHSESLSLSGSVSLSSSQTSLKKKPKISLFTLVFLSFFLLSS